MPYTPTGRPVGRPLKDEPRLLTYSFKADPQFMETVKEYAWRHRTSVGELIRDGLKWRLEEGDLLAYRYIQAPEHPLPDGQTASEEGRPTEERMSNTVIPSSAPVAPATETPAPFDPAIYRLGSACKYGHRSHGEAGNLRHKTKDWCVACNREKKAMEREAKKKAATAPRP